jgi:hypothetical protein
MEQKISRKEISTVDSGTHAGSQVPVGDFVSILMVSLKQKLSRKEVNLNFEQSCTTTLA